MRIPPLVLLLLLPMNHCAEAQASNDRNEESQGPLRRVRRTLQRSLSSSDLKSLFKGSPINADEVLSASSETNAGMNLYSTNPIPPEPAPTNPPTRSPSRSPSTSPTKNPTKAPSRSPSVAPTYHCPDITSDERVALITEILSNVSGVITPGTPQGEALNWILYEDPLEVCPGNDCQLIQRYALAVMYFSTNGDLWFNCGENGECVEPSNPDGKCNPPVRWLSGNNECDWCGNTCNQDKCMTKVDIGKCETAAYLDFGSGINRRSISVV